MNLNFVDVNFNFVQLNYSMAPTDTKKHVLSFLDPKTLLTVQLVSKEFLSLSNEMVIEETRSMPLFYLQNKYESLTKGWENKPLNPKMVNMITEAFKDRTLKGEFTIKTNEYPMGFGPHLQGFQDKGYEVTDKTLFFAVGMTDYKDCDFDYEWTGHGHLRFPQFKGPRYLPFELIKEALTKPQTPLVISYEGKTLKMKYKDVYGTKKNWVEYMQKNELINNKPEEHRLSNLNCYSDFYKSKKQD